MTAQPYTPQPFIPTGAIVEHNNVRYVVLKPNPANLLVERESDGEQFNLPRSATFTIVGQKNITEMFQAPTFEQYSVVTYVGPKFENKLMVVTKVDALTKTATLADIDQPRKRLSRVPFANIVATKVQAVAE